MTTVEIIIGLVFGPVAIMSLIILFKNRKIAKIKIELNVKNDELVKLNEKSTWLEKENVRLREKAEKYDLIENVEEIIKVRNAEISKLTIKLSEIKEEIDPYMFNMELLDAGFFRFKFSFEDVDKYLDALKLLKDAQKKLIKENSAVYTSIKDFYDGLIYKNLSSLSILAFNSEVDSIMRKVTYSNFDASSEKIVKIYDSINKFLSSCNMNITKEYLDLKVKEMTIAYEYEEEKQRQKEEQAEIIAQMREEEASRVEAEKAREKAIEEEKKYQVALDDARKELEGKNEQEREGMLKLIKELEDKLEEAHQEKARATSMAQITKAGHVYIISNLGSFGENVYKIGMTRRKEPMDRVKELGDASVPFQFDVHAMVYSDNAPDLENMLHKKFDNQRMNRINNRKEFFNVSLDEIEKVCTEMGYKIKFTKVAEAREFRESLEIVKEVA